MADKKITQLTEKTSIVLADEIPIVDSEAVPVETKRVSFETLISGTFEELTISAGGEITITGTRHTVDTNGEGAADNLDTISGLSEGQTAILIPENAARVVTIRHGVDNIYCPSDADLILNDLYSVLVVGITGGAVLVIGGGGGALDNTPGRNSIINGCFRIAQRGTSFTAATVPLNSDDTYLLDRWILLSDGNDIVDVTQVVRTTPNGSYAECKLEVETANKQFGLLTILEAKDSARFIGQTVSLSFKARMAAADDNTHSLKAVVLSWSSTADTVTSDVVDAWGATPTYVANWTAENIPASNTLTTTEQTFEIEGIAIDTASTTNIAVFIFCDQTDGVVDDAVIITDVQLELGSLATPFEFRPFGQELILCQRYCVKDVALAVYAYFAFGQAYLTTRAQIFVALSTSMRTIPSLTIPAVANFRLTGANSSVITVTALSIVGSGCHYRQVVLEADVAAGLTPGDITVLGANNTASAYILLDCEL